MSQEGLRGWDHAFNAAAVLGFVSAVVLGFRGSNAVFWLAGLSFAFLGVGNAHRFHYLKVGREGFELRTRQIEIAVEKLQRLFAAIVRFMLATAEGTTRWGGLPVRERTQLTDQLIDALKRINVSDRQLAEVVTEVRQFTILDYEVYILGGSTIPESDDRALQQAWRTLRKRELGDVANPDEIERFLDEFGLLTDEKREQLRDYRYFLEHYEHRRPAVWAKRTEWGRLKPSK